MREISFVGDFYMKCLRFSVSRILKKFLGGLPKKLDGLVVQISAVCTKSCHCFLPKNAQIWEFFLNMWFFVHLLAFFFSFYICGWMMVLDNTLPKDFMRIGYDRKCLNKVRGPRKAIFAQKTQFLCLFFQLHTS